MARENLNVECERCHRHFNENEMDFYEGKNVCRNCEEEMKQGDRL